MNMPRGIYLRKDGRYMWRFQYNKKKYQGYALRLREAERTMVLKKAEVYQLGSLPDVEDSALHVTNPKSNKITLDKLFPEWLEERRKHCKELTCYTYQHNYKNCLQKALGEKCLSEITPDVITEALANLASHYSRTIVNTNITILNGLMAFALKKRLIVKNPMSSATMPVTEPWDRKPVLSKKEEQDFFEAVSNSRFAALYLLAAYTGMRIGEVCGLSWEDIDWENHMIHVRHTLDYTTERGLYLETPKTRSSRREIPMLPRTERLLSKHRKMQKGWKAEAGADWAPVKGMESLVFTTTEGGPLYQGSINYDLNVIRQINRCLIRHFIFDFSRMCAQ